MKMIKPIQCAALMGGILATSAFWLTPVATAQFRVSPLVIEADAERGEAQGVIEVANPGNTTAHITVYAAPFTYDKSGFVELESDLNDLSPYLFFSPQELVLEPGQQRRIRLSARLLPSLPDGEYRAVIFTRSQTSTPGEIDGVRVNVVPRIGVLFFVRKGETVADVVTQSAYFDPLTDQVDLLVSNQGTETTRPIVHWTLKQDGEPLQSGETQPRMLVAGQSYAIPLNYGQDLPAGTYQLEGEFASESQSTPFQLDLIIP